MEKYLKYGLAAIALVLGSIAAMFLIQGAIALGILIFGGIAAWNLIPVVAQKAAHWKIMGLQWNASVNPIPELQLQLEKMVARINEARKMVEAFSVECKIYKQDLDEFLATNPERANDLERAKEYESLYNNMCQVLTKQVASLQKADRGRKDCEQLIESEKGAWKMTQSATRAGKAMRKLKAVDPVDQMRIQAARDAVKKSAHQAMAEMEMALALDFHKEDDVAKAALLSGGDIIDVNFMPIKDVSLISKD